MSLMSIPLVMGFSDEEADTNSYATSSGRLTH